MLLALTATGASAQAAPDIERAQHALKQAGHDPGPIDGVMGARTRAALEAYQKQQGLEASGQLDPATAAKLGGPGEQSRGAGEQSSSASPKTGGDTRPNAVDPAQGAKTGSNVGEGASYSRSTEKGQSAK
jgi:peptidoglycan hydrolase-like protein with peptidoglycan-binding domain